MIELVAATRNEGKLVEIQEALVDSNVHVVSLSRYPRAPEVIEDGETFFANAVKKARAIAEHAHRHAIADDSGLVVDALGGAPGVYSARFAGENATDEENNRKLIELIREVPANKRSARFVCVIAVATPDGLVITAEGSCEGVIVEEPRGVNGFGYDPIFYFPAVGKTFAQFTRKDKLKVSHRGRALYALNKKLADWLGHHPGVL